MDQTKDELIEVAEELGIDYSSRDTKEVLVDKINEASHFESPEQDQPEEDTQPAKKAESIPQPNQLKKFDKFRR
jgi:hypothetical protein